jgi:hypothetical protein
MDHAAAHERIADLALETAGLERLATSQLEADRELRDHLRSCEACRAELEAARRLRDGLRGALEATPEAAMVDPIAPPDSLRSAVLAAAEQDRSNRIAPVRVDIGLPRRVGGGPWRWTAAIAAGLAIALLGGVAGMQLQRTSQVAGDDSITAVVATVDRVLAADGHRIVQLRTPDGTAAGSVAWSQRDFAVLATSLSPPPPGHVYRCWLQWAGESTSIGAMDFAGPTAYWTGSVGQWASVAFDPATRFVVTLEASGVAPPSQPTTPAVLQADLGT